MGDPQDAVKRLHRTLESLLVRLGLTPKPVQRGVSYKLGQATLCRIDPKAEYLRVEVGEEAEFRAPAELRGWPVQRGWLIVRPDQAGLAEDFLSRELGYLQRPGSPDAGRPGP